MFALMAPPHVRVNGARRCSPQWSHCGSAELRSRTTISRRYPPRRNCSRGGAGGQSEVRDVRMSTSTYSHAVGRYRPRHRAGRTDGSAQGGAASPHRRGGGLARRRHALARRPRACRAPGLGAHAARGRLAGRTASRADHASVASRHPGHHHPRRPGTQPRLHRLVLLGAPLPRRPRGRSPTSDDGP